jgi:hypothetical protein
VEHGFKPNFNYLKNTTNKRIFTQRIRKRKEHLDNNLGKAIRKITKINDKVVLPTPFLSDQQRG